MVYIRATFSATAGPSPFILDVPATILYQLKMNIFPATENYLFGQRVELFAHAWDVLFPDYIDPGITYSW